MKISVVMATYNGERYLEQQIQSILSQSLAPSQIVISDDGSTDNTLNIIEKYACEQSNIVVLLGERKGINENFAGALAHCSGDYIALSDQDDIWHKDKLALLAKEACGSALLTYGRSELIDENDERIQCSSESFLGFGHYREGRVPLYFIFSNCVSGHNMLISRELLAETLPFPGECMYDHWIALVAAVRAEIRHVSGAITYHRIHGANSVNNAAQNSLAKKTRPKKSKHGKFSREKNSIVLRLRKGMAESKILSVDDYQFCQKLEQKMERLDGKIFDFELFVLLWRKRKDLFHGRLLRECRNRSLGGKYYRLIDYCRHSSENSRVI